MLISATGSGGRGGDAFISKDNKSCALFALFLIAFAGKTVSYLINNLVHSTDTN